MARLLLVEDEPTHRGAYKHFLAEDGHEVREARCGREAIESAKTFRPSAVVLDLVLPDTVKQVRSGEETRRESRN